MKVILFGATGMVGQGVLRECLLDPEVTEVLTVGRTATGTTHPKVREVAHADLLDLGPLKEALTGYGACFFCVGVTAAGLDEAAYTRVTHDFAVAAAKAVLEANPAITFLFISGEGADSTETSRTMWARVKGKAENAILAMPFRRAYVLRPGVIQPLHGITSRTTLYRVMYRALGPLFPLLKAVAKAHVTSTEELGRTMLHIAKHGAPKRLLRMPDITAVGAVLPRAS